MPEPTRRLPFEFAPEPGPRRSPLLRRYRLFALVVLLAAALSAGAHFFLPLGAVPKLPNWLPRKAVSPNAAVTIVYKWQGADGGWHVSDRPPAHGIPYQRLEYRHDANIVRQAPERRE